WLDPLRRTRPARACLSNERATSRATASLVAVDEKVFPSIGCQPAVIDHENLPFVVMLTSFAPGRGLPAHEPQTPCTLRSILDEADTRSRRESGGMGRITL